MEFTSGEDAVSIVEMMKDLKYYIYLVGKAVAEFERIDFWKNFYSGQNAIKQLHTLQRSLSREEESIDGANLLF